MYLIWFHRNKDKRGGFCFCCFFFLLGFVSGTAIFLCCLSVLWLKIAISWEVGFFFFEVLLTVKKYKMSYKVAGDHGIIGL